jgi:hypothetical protein
MANVANSVLEFYTRISNEESFSPMRVPDR